MLAPGSGGRRYSGERGRQGASGRWASQGCVVPGAHLPSAGPGLSWALSGWQARGEEGRLLPGRRFGRAALTTPAAPRPGVWQVLQGAVRGPPQ